MITPNGDDRTIADDLANLAIKTIEDYRDGIWPNTYYIETMHQGIALGFRMITDTDRHTWLGSAYIDVEICPWGKRMGQGVFMEWNRQSLNHRYLHRNHISAVRIRQVAQEQYDRALAIIAQLQPAQELSNRVETMNLTRSEQDAIGLYADKTGYPIEYEQMTHDHIAAYNAWLDALEQQRKGTNQ